ncbi:hypothetical protein RW1_049_00230 [Rhodococcus wratislaviensis NBRC 100605]|uniref:Uncharacterized protein n=1 Tax=Rhodococcus wratislaviensis NBRC 100605 TaxID=1219028 RepID=X0PXB2_RHOWR|nr:hypothetical protein RW1_049_00230 [Rhodococcus wratislaviensis NBRC 100605]
MSSCLLPVGTYFAHIPDGLGTVDARAVGDVGQLSRLLSNVVRVSVQGQWDSISSTGQTGSLIKTGPFP